MPAVDGSGDPQVSWLIEADGKRALHLGDTIWHGWWWRIRERYGPPDVLLAPLNGPQLNVPHRQRASVLAAATDPEQAALAAQLLQARRRTRPGRASLISIPISAANGIASSSRAGVLTVLP